MELIKGKIAAIVSQKNIVINRGKKHGVTINMFFDIKLDLPEIIDPDDENNKLTEIYYRKGKLRVTKVYDNMSFTSLVPDIIKTYDALGGTISGWAKTVEKYPDVDVDTRISSDDWTIRKGDEVIQVIEEKKEEDQKN